MKHWSWKEILQMIALKKGNAKMLSKYVMEREQMAREETGKALYKIASIYLKKQSLNPTHGYFYQLKQSIDNYLKQKE